MLLLFLYSVTRPSNSSHFDAQVVNKKSESTVLYSKGLHPSGLCVLAVAAAGLLFVCLSFLKLSCAVPGDMDIKLLFGSEATLMH